MIKTIFYLLIGIIVFEVLFLPVYMFLAPVIFPDIAPGHGMQIPGIFTKEPRMLLVTGAFAVLFVTGVILLFKKTLVGKFLVLFAIYEAVNYSYIFGFFHGSPSKDTGGANSLSLLAPAFYFLIPFTIIFWGLVTIIYFARKRKTPQPEKETGEKNFDR